jgi:hypothetical protein
MRFLRRLTAFALLALASLACCAIPSCGTSDSRDTDVPLSLQDLLPRILAEEGMGSRATAALPDGALGDEEWAVGPPGGYSEDNLLHQMTLDSAGSGPGDPLFQCYAVYKLEGHHTDAVARLRLDLDCLAGQYYVYIVNYGPPARWHSFGPYTVDPQAPDFPLILDFDCVSPLGNVYVAISTYGDSEVRINSLTADEYQPPVEGYYETENNDTALQADALPAFPFGNGTVIGSAGPGGGYYDGDNTDWYSFIAPESGTVFLTLTDFIQSEANLNLYLYTADGATLLGESSGTDNGEQVTRMLAAGTYTVKVQVWGPGPTKYTDYELRGTFYPDSAGIDFYETEPNDSAAAADALPPAPFPSGAPLIGSLGPGGSNYDGSVDDWYSFTLPQRMVAHLEMLRDPNAGAAEPRLDLIGSDGLTLLDLDSGSAKALLSVEGVLDAGTYYLRCTADSGSFDYLLQGFYTPVDPGQYYETEDNDSWNAADPLPALPFTLDEVRGSIGQGGGYYDGDVADWYSFTVSAGQTNGFSAVRIGGTGSGTLSIVDTNGTTVLDSDNSAPYQVSYDIDITGTYYLRLQAALEGFDYALSGGWLAYDEVEDNDTRDTAMTLPNLPFSGFNGDIGPAGFNDGDTGDWYKLTVGTERVCELRLTPYSGNQLPYIELYAADGETLRDSYYETTEQYVGDTLEPGTYFLFIGSVSGYCHYVLDGYVRTPMGTFDEVENNDTHLTGNVLPPLPVNDWRGSLGSSDSFYDCDHGDWYVLELDDWAVLHLTLAADSIAGGTDLNMKFYAVDGTTEMFASVLGGQVESIVTDANNEPLDGNQPIPSGTYYV